MAIYTEQDRIADNTLTALLEDFIKYLSQQNVKNDDVRRAYNDVLTWIENYIDSRFE